MKNCDNCKHWDCGMFTEPCNSCYKIPDGMSEWVAREDNTPTPADTDNNMLSDILRTALRDLHATPNCATCVISDKYVCEQCAKDHYAAYKWRYEDVALALISDNE